MLENIHWIIFFLIKKKKYKFILYKKLDLDFYLRDDVIQISKELLGKFLFSKADGIITGGMIVETEAYKGINDKASHAYKNKINNKNRVMYRSGGISYIYLCYGLHYLFNIITNKKTIPDAILIRAIEPTKGLKKIIERRMISSNKYNLTNGPGKLSKALNINKTNNGKCLINSKIWLEDRKITINNSMINSKKRIGIDYAEEYTNKKWRFYIKNNPWVSVK